MKGVWKFVGGCFVGAASAIVVSPKSGREMRRQIAHRLAAGLERTGAEGAVGQQPRRAEPVWLEEQPPMAESVAVAPPAAAAAAPEAVAVVVEPEPTVVEPEPAPVVVVTPLAPPTGPAVPEPAVVVAEMVVSEPAVVVAEMVVPEPVVAAVEPEPVVAAAEPPAPVVPAPVVPAPVATAPVAPLTEPPAADLELAVAEPEPVVVAAVETPPVVEGVAPVVAFDDLVVEPATPSAPPPGEPLEHPGLEDLRARIEQTKAAVREALERPFVVEESAEGAAPAVAEETPAVSSARDDWFDERSEPVTAPEPGVEPVAAPEPVVGPVAGLDLIAEPGPVAEAVAEPAPAVVAQPAVVAEPPAEAELPVASPAAVQVSPEAALVSQIETALEPFTAAPTPAAPPPSPPEGAGVWVAPAAVAADAASLSATAETNAPPSEEMTMDLGPELRVSVAEAPSGGVDASSTGVSNLDRAVAEAFSFDETDEEPPEAPVVDQAEMRRRIEETRARLKAKAFDAMASGESALLAREPSEQAPAAAVDEQREVKLDDEVRQVIDRSLSPDDF